MVFVFFSSYSPRYQNPSSSFLIFTVDFTFISGDPGPNALGANLVSHFQLPSNGFMYASSSADGLGIGGPGGGGRRRGGRGRRRGGSGLGRRCLVLGAADDGQKQHQRTGSADPDQSVSSHGSSSCWAAP